jgi:hypothetical protein
MLKSVWDRAVRGYQYARQASDREYLQAIDNRLDEARKGYQTIVIPGSPLIFTGMRIVRQELSPEGAAAIIRNGESARAELVEKMQRRRERYALTI